MTRSTDVLVPRDQLIIALSAGLLAAAGELVMLAIRRFGFHEDLRLGADVIWMAPLNEALLFGLVGVLLIILAAVMRRVGVPGAARLGVFVPALIAGLAIALAIPRLHNIARLVLAIGLAIRVTMLVSESPRAMALSRRIAGSLAALFLAAGAMLGVWRLVSERRAVAAVPPAAAGTPNVLFIIWDTVRWSSLGTYGYARPTTPRLDRLAAHAVTFDRAFSTAPWTLASHASMFTGHFPYEMEGADLRTRFGREYPTLAERLSAAGMVTAGFVANTYYLNAENGLGRGFLHYQDFVVSPGEIFLATSIGRALSANGRFRRLTHYHDVIGRRSADNIARSFLDWVGRRPDRPFFAFLNFYDAHLPYLPPEPWRSRFGPQGALELWRLDHNRTRTAELFGRTGMTPAQKRELQDDYDGAIAYQDDRLGLMLDSLDRLGILRNTIVIVSSDHGEGFGEHGIFGHNRSLYVQETQVPLVIRVPGEDAAAVRISVPVSLRELPATVLDLTRIGRDAAFPGHTLSRFWRSTPGVIAEQDTVLAQFAQYTLSGVTAGRHHLLRDRQGVMHLFDLDTDPHEEHDLAGTPEGAHVMASIGATYRAALAAKPRHRADAQ